MVVVAAEQLKNDSLFNQGMRPVCLSKKKRDKTGESWFRGCVNINYTKNQIPKEQGQNTYYTLSFSYRFEYSDDVVQFAHCYPYTFSDLNSYLVKVAEDPQKCNFLQKRTLCQTLAKNNVDLLTITANHDIVSAFSTF